jgi:AcrR family transcriptional regulator
MAGRKPRKRLTAADRRARILRAAELVFAEHGYESASVEQIAVAAGVTKPVLYDHFASKLDLFVRLSEAIRDEMLARGQAAVARAGDGESRMRAGVETFFAFVEERPAAARVMFIVPREQKVLARSVGAVQRGATESLSILLRAIVKPADDVEAGAITEFLKQGLHALAEWWADHPKVPRAVLVETVMDIAWRGLAARALPQNRSAKPF